MTKYQQVFMDMMENHKDVFHEFQKIHDQYAKDAKKFQKELDEKGEEVLILIRRYENILCGHSESGRFGKFSSNLSEKFWETIRTKFSKIDFIGLK